MILRKREWTELCTKAIRPSTSAPHAVDLSKAVRANHRCGALLLRAKSAHPTFSCRRGLVEMCGLDVQSSRFAISE